MQNAISPLHLLILAVAGWLNRHQQRVLDYLKEEDRIFKEQVGRRRPRLTDDQRRRLAVKGKILGRKLLVEYASLVTPDTVLRWHQRLIAKKWDFSQQRGRVGRPRVMEEVRALVLRMARTNLRWGYSRIQGALMNLGHEVGRTTVANILKEHGLDGADRRKHKTTWHAFLRSHWDCLAALDFFTVEVWTSEVLEGAGNTDAATVGLRRERYSWAELLARVFALDILRCPCGARREIIAMITAPPVIRAILECLHLYPDEVVTDPAHGPP